MKKFLILALLAMGCSSTHQHVELVKSATLCVEKNELYTQPVVKLEIKIK